MIFRLVKIMSVNNQTFVYDYDYVPGCWLSNSIFFFLWILLSHSESTKYEKISWSSQAKYYWEEQFVTNTLCHSEMSCRIVSVTVSSEEAFICTIQWKTLYILVIETALGKNTIKYSCLFFLFSYLMALSDMIVTTYFLASFQMGRSSFSPLKGKGLSVL